MPKRKRVTDEQARAALARHDGRVGRAAKELGISRQALYKRIPALKELEKKERFRERMEMVARAMQGLIRMIHQGNPWACKYYLTKWGGHLGWTTSPVVELAERYRNVLPLLGGDVDLFENEISRIQTAGRGQRRRRSVERAAAYALKTTPKEVSGLLVAGEVMLAVIDRKASC